MPTRHALLLLNPLSRSGQTDLSNAVERLGGLGVDATLRTVDKPADIPATILEYGGPLDMVIVAGGDGTLNCAVDAVLEKGAPLGILPLGTANDLARTLGIPQDIDEACDIIAQGRLHAIDLGWVNGKHFFNVASIGLSVRITEELTGALKRRWGLLSYAISAARAIRSAPPFTAEIVYDGRSLRVRSMQVAIGNGRHYGGGMTIAEGASIDDGLLHLYSISPRNALRYLAMLPALRRGRQAQWQGVHVLEGRDVHLTTRPSLAVNTDGEITTRTPARFRVIPAALPVAVPEQYATRHGDPACSETTAKSPSMT